MKNILKVKGKVKVLPLIGLTLVPLLGGGGIAYIIRNSINVYSGLDKPVFAPPLIIFMVIWPILYLLMGFASYRIYMIREGGVNVGTSLFFYLIQLLLNYLWPLLFFSFRLYGLAFIELIILFIFVVITFIKFIKLDKISGFLLVPYLIALIFSGVLNYFIWAKNEM